jgi:hypothetical protein
VDSALSAPLALEIVLGDFVSSLHKQCSRFVEFPVSRSFFIVSLLRNQSYSPPTLFSVAFMRPAQLAAPGRSEEYGGNAGAHRCLTFARLTEALQAVRVSLVCREQDLNLHAFWALDPKSNASANSAIPA